MPIEEMPLFPLNTVLFPDGYLPMQIFEVRYLDLIRNCLRTKTPFGIVGLLEGNEVRKPDEAPMFSEVGTLANITDCDAPMPTLLKIQTRGGDRFKLFSSEQRKNGLWVGQIQRMTADAPIQVPEHLQASSDTLANLIETLETSDLSPEQIPVKPPMRLNDCGWVANRWCELMPLEKTTKIQLLALDNPLLRLELVTDELEARGLI
jgi:Lon protease-like protein